MTEEKNECGCNCRTKIRKNDKQEIADEKLENLKGAIEDLGYKVEETEDGEIKVTK